MDIREFFNEPSPLLELEISDTESYKVYRQDDMSVDSAIRLMRIIAALQLASKKNDNEILRLKESGLSEEELTIESTLLQADMLPLMRDYIEAAAQMPQGRLKKLSTSEIADLFEGINYAMRSQTEEVGEASGESPSPTKSSSASEG